MDFLNPRSSNLSAPTKVTSKKVIVADLSLRSMVLIVWNDDVDIEQHTQGREDLKAATRRRVNTVETVFPSTLPTAASNATKFRTSALTSQQSDAQRHALAGSDMTFRRL